MGEKKQRRARFFAEHPQCCFCGGDAGATTVDHVPNRACFADRLAPEGYEFPACDACQGSTRLDEIAFAFMVHTLNENPRDFDTTQYQRLVAGLRNNLPHLSAIRELSTPEKRRAVRELALIKHPGEAVSEMGIVKIPPEWHDHIRRYLDKLTKALFYFHVGAAAPADAYVWSMWTYGRIGKNREAIEAWIEMTPEFHKGARTNVDIGERFRYRCNYSAEHKAFAVVGQFGNGLIFYGICTSRELGDQLRPGLIDN